MEYLLKGWFYLKYGCLESKRHKVHFSLALLSCVIVVTVACVIRTVLDHAPLIFLRTAEGTAGEIDLQITPQESDKYLNNTRINQILSEKSAPRVKFTRSKASCIGCQLQDEDISLIFLDSKIEDDIELGRSYPFDQLEIGECYIHKKIALALGLKVGDKVQISDLDTT